MSKFYDRGQRDAKYDVTHDQFGDVPAILTATYSEAPTTIEMEHYAEGYFETGLGLGISAGVVKSERGRFLSFLAGRSCEGKFFGEISPGEDRGGRKHRV